MPYFTTDRRNQIYYELINNAKNNLKNPETLIFLHGWAEHQKIWREQIEFFKNNYQLLTLDLRGFGFSSKPTYGYSIKQQANYLHELIGSLEIHEYWVIGHSLGGMITLKYCEKFFEEMKGAVLISTTSYFPTKLSVWRNLGAFFIQNTLKQMWQRTLKSTSLERQRSIIQDLIQDVDSVPLYVSAACGLAVLNSKFHLKSILCPILIIIGENDSLTPVELSKKMHEKLPNSQLTIIQGAGHLPFIEKSEEINLIMAQFFLHK